MEINNNIFLGMIEKRGCYVNNGKYGYFLTCGKKITRFHNGLMLMKFL